MARDAGPAGLPFGHLTAVDDQASRYQADHTALSPYGRWSVAFELTPVPPPGTRWLDITGPATQHGPGPGRPGRPASRSHAIRSHPIPSHADPGLWASLGARVSPADRPLDALAEKLLAEVTHGHGTGDAALAGLAEVVGALRAATGLTESAALGRLAALAGRLGLAVPGGRCGRWPSPPGCRTRGLSVLEHRGAADGPDRVAAVAAVLPEVDGARFAVAGLDSAADSATLRVMAWGWQPSPLTSLE